MQYLYAHPIWTALIGAVLLTLLILATTSATYHVTGLLDHYVWQPGLKLAGRTMDRAGRRVSRLGDTLIWDHPCGQRHNWRCRVGEALFSLEHRLDSMLYRPLAHANGCWSYDEQDAFLAKFGDVPPHPSVADPENPWLYAEEVPLFEHDCDQCEYLGRFEGRDLYYCAFEPTVISRDSSEGGDYSSGLCFAEGPNPMPRLAEALRRARLKGLCA